jgi:uncharacterized protein (TIGR00369 family)
MLERLQSRLASGDYAPVCQLLGMEVTKIEVGSAEVFMNCHSQMFNPFGTVHGGILCDFADMAMGTAFFTTLQDGEALATVELKINFLRPVRSEKITAAARVLHRGRNTGYVECEVTNAEGKLVAKAASTCMIVRDDRTANL